MTQSDFTGRLRKKLTESSWWSWWCVWWRLPSRFSWHLLTGGSWNLFHGGRNPDFGSQSYGLWYEVWPWYGGCRWRRGGEAGGNIEVVANGGVCGLCGCVNLINGVLLLWLNFRVVDIDFLQMQFFWVSRKRVTDSATRKEGLGVSLGVIMFALWNSMSRRRIWVVYLCGAFLVYSHNRR